MDLKFVGKGSAFTPQLKNTSAYFVFEDSFFLLDCGETVFSEIWNLKYMTESKNIYVLVTHLHCDHIGSLGSLISYCYYSLDKRITIVHPIESVIELLDLMGIKREIYDYMAYLPEEVQGLSLEAISVKHVDNMQCYGYLLSTDESKIYYSGDSYEIPQVILEAFLNGEIDQLYQDTSIKAAKKPSHLDLNSLEKMIPLDMREQIYCMHLGGSDVTEYTSRGFNTV